jgi:putative membrane protein
VRVIIFFLIFLLICTLSILFFAQNDQAVTLSYFVGQSDIPLAFIIVGSLLLGYLIGVISLSASVFKLRMQLRQSRNQLAQKTEEVENLRALPIREDF